MCYVTSTHNVAVWYIVIDLRGLKETLCRLQLISHNAAVTSMIAAGESDGW